MAYLQDVAYEVPADITNRAFQKACFADPMDLCPRSDRREAVPDVEAFLRGDHGKFYSVFTVDPRSRELVLVRIKDGVHVDAYPFLYEVQREKAEKALYVPLDLAYKVALSLCQTLKEEKVRLVHLFSTGRCGSTLLCKAMGAIDEGGTTALQSLSEPDAYSNLCVQRSLYEDPEVQKTLCFSVTMLLAYWAWRRAPMKRIVCVKYRSLVTRLAPLFRASPAYPYPSTMSSIFLYRHALGHAESWLRLQYAGNYWLYYGVSSVGVAERWLYGIMEGANRKMTLRSTLQAHDHVSSKAIMARRYLRFPCPPIPTLHAHYLMLWLDPMEEAAQYLQTDPKAFDAVLSYERLRDGKEAVAFELCRRLGILSSSDLVDRTALSKVFQTNSQQGSVMSSTKVAGDTWLGDWERRRLEDALAFHKGGLIDSLDYTFEQEL